MNFEHMCAVDVVAYSPFAVVAPCERVAQGHRVLLRRAGPTFPASSCARLFAKTPNAVH